MTNDMGGCEGCVQEAIRNRNKEFYIKQDAEKYAKDNKVNVVVWFNGVDYGFTKEAEFNPQKGNAIAYYVP